VNAKLANFSRAQLDVKDADVLAKDCRAFGVFIYNLFVKDLCDCVMPGESFSPNQLLSFSRGLDGLERLLQSLLSGSVFLAREVDERLAALHQELQNPEMKPSPLPLPSPGVALDAGMRLIEIDSSESLNPIALNSIDESQSMQGNHQSSSSGSTHSSAERVL
jgi:hypothetical protein